MGSPAPARGRARRCRPRSPRGRRRHRSTGNSAPRVPFRLVAHVGLEAKLGAGGARAQPVEEVGVAVADPLRAVDRVTTDRGGVRDAVEAVDAAPRCLPRRWACARRRNPARSCSGGCPRTRSSPRRRRGGEWDEQLNAGFVCSLQLDVNPSEPSCPASAQAPNRPTNTPQGKDS